MQRIKDVTLLKMLLQGFLRFVMEQQRNALRYLMKSQ